MLHVDTKYEFCGSKSIHDTAKYLVFESYDSLFSHFHQTHSGVDLPAGDGGALVVVSQTGSFGSDPLHALYHTM